MAKRIAKITYETEACSRCGGGGRYSFNLLDGDKCYGCGGTGQTYTRNGRRANLAVKKFILEQFGRRADEVELGQRVRLAGDRGYRRVLAISVPVRVRDGKLEQLNEDCLTLHTKHVQLGLQCRTVVQVAPTTEQFQGELVPFARGFQGAIFHEAT